MKRKISAGLVFAAILALVSVTALAAGLLLSPKVSASRTADAALEKTYGVTAEMQTFFGREEEDLGNGTVRVTYTGIGAVDYAVGTYTAVVRGGKAEVSWSHDGEDVSGGYGAEAWGSGQLRQMLADSRDPKAKQAYMDRGEEIAVKHHARSGEEDAPSEADEGYHEKREAEKTAAMKARKLTEEEMTGIGREFIITSYGLNDEQVSRLELYTNSFADGGNTWYEMIDGKPCFQVEYLLNGEYTTEQMENNEPRSRTEMDGYYIVYVNVETGTVEQYEYNSALGGEG